MPVNQQDFPERSKTGQCQDFHIDWVVLFLPKRFAFPKTLFNFQHQRGRKNVLVLTLPLGIFTVPLFPLRLVRKYFECVQCNYTYMFYLIMVIWREEEKFENKKRHQLSSFTKMYIIRYEVSMFKHQSKFPTKHLTKFRPQKIYRLAGLGALKLWIVWSGTFLRSAIEPFQNHAKIVNCLVGYYIFGQKSQPNLRNSKNNYSNPEIVIIPIYQSVWNALRA